MADLEDTVQHIRIEGGDEVTAALSNIANAGAAAFAQIAESASHGDFTGLIEKFAGELPAAIAKTTESILEFVHEQAHAIETLGHLAEATGATIGQFYGLNEVFASVGISTMGFERSFGRLAMSIGQAWSQIQANVRNGATEHAASELQIKEALLGVQRAYESLDQTIHKSHAQAISDAQAVTSAEIAAKRARNELAMGPEVAAEGIRSAALAYTRAKLEYDKALGYNVSQDEKDLNEKEKLLALQKAQTAYTQVSINEELKAKENRLAVERADQALIEARHKKEEDAIKASIELKQQQLGIDKARLAVQESMQKAHELELKDIDAIAAKINLVAEGQTKWKDQMVLTEASAQTLRTAIIRAASLDNGGAEPNAVQVFEKMSELFRSGAGEAMDMNEKMALVQRLMGAGFRAGQASASQIVAAASKSKEAVAALRDESERFSKSGIGVGAPQVKILEEFNAAWASLGVIIGQVAGRIAAVLASDLIGWLDGIKSSILEDNGILHIFLQALVSIAEWGMLGGKVIIGTLGALNGVLTTLIKGVQDLIGAFSALSGLKSDTMFYTMYASAGLAVMALTGIGRAVAYAMGRMEAWAIIIGTVTKGIAEMVEVAGFLANNDAMMKFGIGLERAANAVLRSATGGISDKVGATNTTLGGVEDPGAKLTEAAQEQHTAAGQQHSAADDLKDAAQQWMQAATQMQAMLNHKTPGMATGGPVRGPGGPTEDKAGLFRLSDGEYVMKSAAVSHYGPELFDALNSLNVGGMATGGYIGAPRVAASTATLSSDSPSSILNLTIGEETFGGLRAPENVATRLRQFAIGRQSAATGDMPSWVG